MVVAGRHLGESEPFVIVLAAFSCVGPFLDGIERAIQNMNLSAGRQQRKECNNQARKILKVLDGTCDHNEVECAAGKWSHKHIGGNPAQTLIRREYPAGLPQFRGVAIQANDGSDAGTRHSV